MGTRQRGEGKRLSARGQKRNRDSPGLANRPIVLTGRGTRSGGPHCPASPIDRLENEHERKSIRHDAKVNLMRPGESADSIVGDGTGPRGPHCLTSLIDSLENEDERKNSRPDTKVNLMPTRESADSIVGDGTGPRGPHCPTSPIDGLENKHERKSIRPDEKAVRARGGAKG